MHWAMLIAGYDVFDHVAQPRKHGLQLVTGLL